ncbi:YjdF family protein [Bacillus massiliigorillae]|uniref:YjdF family protein n=1 Tax=Bacillus massiliigorillae TaxID=1243664 RepID=UPI0003AAADE3|nr:YjdF family protein [Bacillus massiliigorillae]
MKLSIFYDGQYFIGLVEIKSNNKLQVYRYIFGQEPKDQDVLDFIHNDLLRLIEKHDQTGVPIKKECLKKINPKRLQRKVSKEIQQRGISTKAQEALKEEYEQRKKVQHIQTKEVKEAQKQYKREIKVQKAKNKHRGK